MALILGIDLVRSLRLEVMIPNFKPNKQGLRGVKARDGGFNLRYRSCPRLAARGYDSKLQTVPDSNPKEERPLVMVISISYHEDGGAMTGRTHRVPSRTHAG